jgi:hypothetical protein
MLSLSLYPHHTLAVVVAAPIIVGTTSFSFIEPAGPGLVDSTIDRVYCMMYLVNTSAWGAKRALFGRETTKKKLSGILLSLPIPISSLSFFEEKHVHVGIHIFEFKKLCQTFKFLRNAKDWPKLPPTSSTLFFGPVRLLHNIIICCVMEGD